MLSKLPLRNARRQAQDYFVYFVPMVMAAALLYAPHGPMFSGGVRNLAEGMKNLPLVIVLVSVVVACIFAGRRNRA